MKTNIQCICLIFCFSVACLLSSKIIYAETISHVVTSGFSFNGVNGINGLVIHGKTLPIHYDEGTMVFSFNPDGTGNMFVGDGVQIIVNRPNASTRVYTYSMLSDSGCPVWGGSFNSELPPVDVTDLFMPGLNNVLVRYLAWCNRPFTLSSAYLVNSIPDSTPSPSPTPTPVLSPTPAPFLELPWDYQSKGMDFHDAALSMSAYFDHEYPFLSNGLSEVNDEIGTIVTYESKFRRRTDLSYSTHDGYDYALVAGVTLGEPVLAAASGTARYVKSCGACGNMILIDHGNGYQTRYMHLQEEDLITDDTSQMITVTAGQEIGKVGYTGNVDPAGEGGSHLHFAVFQDKNNDGNFSDNIIDGVTDPFGWQSPDPDPWEQYTFVHDDIQKTGNKSYYLWKHPLELPQPPAKAEGTTTTAHRFTITFPPGATDEELKLRILPAPRVDPFIGVTSIGPSYIVETHTLQGDLFTQFLKPLTILFNFANFDLSRINKNSLSIYSSPDGESWVREETIIDMTTNTAFTSIEHLTHFALMAERLDTVAPTTTAQLSGEQGPLGHFLSDVTVSLTPIDNEGGLGIAYTPIKITSPLLQTDWEEYTEPITFTEDGDYTIKFYSADKDDNIEIPQSVSFTINKSAPEVEITYDMSMFDFVVFGKDGENEPIPAVVEDLKKNEVKYTASNTIGNTLTVLAKDKEKGKKATINIYSLQYNHDPMIDLGKNRIHAAVQLNEDGSLKELSQAFEVKGEVKVRLEYSGKKNKTKVIVKEKDKDKEKEEREGILLLKIFTDKGKLDYTYSSPPSGGS